MLCVVNIMWNLVDSKDIFSIGQVGVSAPFLTKEWKDHAESLRQRKGTHRLIQRRRALATMFLI